ncbi:RraA family protein [Fodinibius salsisoli]|uniref:Putative 4-hydroxy-4-methyl-2-oxoglutarate aldolase n=1 Tax=Fodinibius salsisoli TaxID=2820877 RepID=A0ABT3PKQ5_9BACT|nr:RraA family protein [Fodinibius salsisoli]MCW9706511.1 RraA family protein [Fodinibius salsisoli]
MNILNRLGILLFFGFIVVCLELSSAEAQHTVSDAKLLELYGNLRVADVSDGLDMVGLRDQGLMNQKIEALWKDIDGLSHIARGIAVTARYVPTNKVVKNPMSEEEFKAWEGDWYSNISPEPFVDSLTEGSILVIDAQGDGDTGTMGSYNGLLWKSKGTRAVVSNGAVRDTDEIIKQEIPVYLDHQNRGRGIRPGRNEIESVNKPVVVGGVLVNPGDIVVADGDGVVVVPRKHAVEVARYAREILKSDKEARRSLYEKLGIPLDQTVEADSSSE